MPTRSISVIADFFQQPSSVFNHLGRKFMLSNGAGCSFVRENKAGLVGMV